VSELIGLPVPEPERYVTTAELAALMGVSDRQIRKFRAEGMPYESWGLRAVRFQPSRAMAWARTRERTHGSQEAA
jgi:phage terminase Nu1 subunit (DNA packaging protein)